jgi:ATP-dependent RNA helicase DHX36
MVLLGSLFKCLDPILIMAAIESNRSFFLSPPGSTDQGNAIRLGMALGQPSDHLALLNAFREWRFIKNTRGRIAANEYAYANLMHSGGLQTIEKTAEQMLEMLVKWGLAKDIPVSQRYNNELGDPELNINSDVQPLIFSLLTSGLMPNLAVQMNPILLQTTVDPKALIHPGSLNSNGGEQKVDKRARYVGAGPPGTLVLFSSKSLAGGGVFLRDTTVIGPMTGLMFSGKLEPSDDKNILYIDDWLPFKFGSGVAKNVLQLTQSIEKVQSQKNKNPPLILVFGQNLGTTQSSFETTEYPPTRRRPIILGRRSLSRARRESSRRDSGEIGTPGEIETTNGSSGL